ncbi:hypothetical protein LDENG_00294490 [Lucifuga dentata]|nr:hypothetical protein LDENG_00294490 [Lucifuga dentata]
MQEAEPRIWTLTAATCGVGILVLLVRKISSNHEAKNKILRARKRRDETLQQAEQAVRRYTDSALDVDKKLNCCTGVLLESLDQLKTLDSIKKGLLYGVPVSIKKNIAYTSYDCTNPIYGQSLNPHNLHKTTGGSSGGEGGLIGGGGSILGIGTDIGGSIHIPAAFCGISGFKPTSGRLRCSTCVFLSLRGVSTGFRGQKSVNSTAGSMAKDVDSLALCMQTLLCDHMFSLDPILPPLPFNMQSSRSLRIGYCENDGFTQPSPSMARAVREVKALLERAGRTLVPYTPLKIFRCRLPRLVKRFFSVIMKPLFPRIAAAFSAISGFRSIPELWAHHNSIEDYIQEKTIAEWRSCNIEVLLCPMIGPAYNLNYCTKVRSAISYTMLYNLLNFPAGVVPVTMVTEEDELQLRFYKGIYQDILDKSFKQAVAGGEGLPVAVQCVALPWQDELCLRFMKEVEQLVKQKRR